MRQYKVLISEQENFDNSFIVSLSKTEYDNLKLLRQYIPNSKKDYYTEEEKEAITKFNSFIRELKDKSRNSSVQIDIALKTIE